MLLGLRDLSSLKEVAVVTGRFKSEDVLKQHILGVVGKLEYTYIVGIENLNMFKKGAEALVPLATPHISIIRKTGQGANSLTMSKDYVGLGPDYTCQIRKHYEELYGSRIIGNNFANIWLFPLNEFNLSSYLARIHS